VWGGALDLVLSCDLVTADETASFAAAPLDARKAREWLVINHLVSSDRLESFTLELAGGMAAKSPMAISVIKEQLRVLSAYQPIAAQVYERIQGLRRKAYDSSDYLEGLDAFAQKREPIFRGT
jgi:methylmalonyl-CoA decarboxylase